MILAAQINNAELIRVKATKGNRAIASYNDLISNLGNSVAALNAVDGAVNLLLNRLKD